jgi:hypothetical protein
VPLPEQDREEMAIALAGVSTLLRRASAFSNPYEEL